jgi:DNA-binding XRE family transcriptional regulator
MNRLRECRKAAGLSQEKLAVEADVARSTLHRAECGELPKVHTAIKLARVLGVTVEYLWGDDVQYEI